MIRLAASPDFRSLRDFGSLQRLPEASSACLAARLLGRMTAPLQAAIRAEMKVRLQEALNRMDPLDRVHPLSGNPSRLPETARDES